VRPQEHRVEKLTIGRGAQPQVHDCPVVRVDVVLSFGGRTHVHVGGARPWILEEYRNANGPNGRVNIGSFDRLRVRRW
jgi:hypothetical protein